MWRKDQCQAGEDGLEGITSLTIDSISRSQSPLFLPDNSEGAITEALAYQTVKCFPAHGSTFPSEAKRTAVSLQ